MGTFSDYFERRITEAMGSDVPPGAPTPGPGAGGIPAKTKPMWGPAPTKITPYSLAMELGVPVLKVIQALTAMGVKSRKGQIDPASTMPQQIADKVRAQLDQRRFKTQPGGPDGVNWMG